MPFEERKPVLKLFAVSDIHGYAELMKEALSASGYDYQNKDHLLICCGDCFDRGTENRNVLRFFERIDRKVMVKGNHDERLNEIMDTGELGFHDYLNGTIVTLQEFFGKYAVSGILDPVDFTGRTGEVRRLSAFIGEMKDYYETAHYVFVHGWLPNENGKVLPDWRNATAAQWSEARWTLWPDGRAMPGYHDGKTIVCGHYPTFENDYGIRYEQGMIAIDAGTDTSKKINVLVLEDELLEAPLQSTDELSGDNDVT